MKLAIKRFFKINSHNNFFKALAGFGRSLNISTRKLLLDFYTIFEKHGYVVGKIFPRNVEFRKYEVKLEDFIGPNFIAVHKDERKIIESFEKKSWY